MTINLKKETQIKNQIYLEIPKRETQRRKSKLTGGVGIGAEKWAHSQDVNVSAKSTKENDERCIIEHDIINVSSDEDNQQEKSLDGNFCNMI